MVSGESRHYRKRSTLVSVVQDEVGTLLGYHHHGSLGVAADHGRHDRSIDHAQAFHAAQPQAGVDHGLVIVAHATGANGVVDGLAVLAGEFQPLFVGLHGIARVHFVGHVVSQGGLLHDVARHFHAAHQAVAVFGFRQEVGTDAQASLVAAAANVDAALGLGAQLGHADGHAGFAVQAAVGRIGVS